VVPHLTDDPKLTKLLENLNSNIMTLTKITALTLRNATLFKGTETTPEQIEILEKMELPDDVIALVIGSTVNSVQAQRSQKKAKEKKSPKAEPATSEGAEKVE
jgi:hypothetical protein